ncbi:MAG: hypothetical protein ACRELX_17300, partial [Longimicrobiales bacterium]
MIAAKPRRRRILYAQAATGGGSAVGLCELLRHLDTTRYEPVVLFYRPNRYCDEVRGIGAEVLVLD